jgi:hypothetical protein
MHKIALAAALSFLCAIANAGPGRADPVADFTPAR